MSQAGSQEVAFQGKGTRPPVLSLAMQSVGSGRELALQHGHARAWWWGQGW